MYQYDIDTSYAIQSLFYIWFRMTYSSSIYQIYIGVIVGFGIFCLGFFIFLIYMLYISCCSRRHSQDQSLKQILIKN